MNINSTSDNDIEASKVEIRKGKDGGIYLSNVIERDVKELNQALDIFKDGSQNRHNAATILNERSSRSHAVVIFTLNMNNKTSGDKILSQL